VKLIVRIALGCLAVVILWVVAVPVVTGRTDDADRASTPVGVPADLASTPTDLASAPTDSTSTPVAPREPAPTPMVSMHERALKHEALPCTGPKDPVNFEVFSAGSAPAGLPLTGTSRRCDTGPVPQGWSSSNYVDYIYGNCEIPNGATGCQPPLDIQTWPACQRSKAEYTFGGQPLPFRRLPELGSAEVVEFTSPFERIEVYTKSATVVIFATDMDLARKAVPLLRLQEEETPPVTPADSGSLEGAPPKGLPAPSAGSMKGTLPC